MRLKDLLSYDDIIVQCHDNPDADAIASGFGVYLFLKARGKNVRFIYGGKFEIAKTNLKFFIDTFSIPIEYVTSLDTVPKLLVTCDCQYGSGNVQKFEADEIAVIDHHQVAAGLPKLSEVRSGTGSCSTVVWALLKDEGFELDRTLSTVLYYGLYMDTNGLSEMSHPLDKDMYDDLLARHDRSLIKKMTNMNITLEEARIAGVALLGVEFNENFRYAVIESKPCDPNLLGLINDFMLSVDSVDVSVVYSVVNNGVKFSVRSCIVEVNADELAKYISEGLGSGGGHLDKAGGFLDDKLIGRALKAFCDSDEETKCRMVKEIIAGRLYKYFTNTSVIHSDDYKPDFANMTLCERLPMIQGFVIPSNIVPIGTKLLVRSFEGDIDVVVNDETVIMIGSRGEAFITSKEYFEANFVPQDNLYRPNVDYFPTARISSSGISLELAPFTFACLFPGGNRIYVKKLGCTTKIFGKWSGTEYLKGNPGDYLAAREDDPSDVFIISAENFLQKYQIV